MCNNSSNSLLEVDINKLEVKDDTTIKIMNDINEKVSDDSIDKIIIIYSDDKILNNKTFKSVCGYLSIYKKEDDIIVLKETSSDKESEIKIITVKE
ncbi:hypothetical protein [Clostridium sp.]|uniref:hypothetical protein n=1 Tax=Clostridium sp. TaxID=1506 RepID=UPI0026229EF2|nr:hypothetical protein [Clostridium sp.]